MTNHLLMTPAIEKLVASADPSVLFLISDRVQDAAMLNVQTGCKVAYADTINAEIAGKEIVFIPIAMEGFFDLLQRTDRSRVQVVAIINDLAEEFVTAKFIGVPAALRVTLNVNGDVDVPQPVLCPVHAELA